MDQSTDSAAAATISENTTTSAEQERLDRVLGVFSKLPSEIFSRIFTFVLRPDCTLQLHENDGGWGYPCTKTHEHVEGRTNRCDILVLSSEMYNRALPLLHKQSDTYGLFSFSYKSASTLSHGYISAYTVPRFNIQIDLPEQCSWRTWFERGRFEQARAMICQIKGLIKVIQKRKMPIQCVEVYLRRGLPTDPYAVEVADTKPFYKMQAKRDKMLGIGRLLTQLVLAVHERGGEVKVGREVFFLCDKFSHDDEPLVPWLLQVALERGIVVERLLDLHWRDRHEGNRHAHTIRRSSPAVPNLVYGVDEDDIKAVDGLTGRRETIPECRCCRTIFDTKAALESHLREGR